MNNVDRFEVEKWFGTIEETALNFQIAIDCNILITPSSRAQSVGDCAANLLYYIRATGDTSIAKRCCAIEREGLAHIEGQEFVRCCVILTTIEDELLKRCGYSKEDGYCISDKGETVKYCGNGKNNGCVVGRVDDLLNGKQSADNFAIPQYLTENKGDEALKILEDTTGYGNKPVLDRSKTPWVISSMSDWGKAAQIITQKLSVEIRWADWANLIGKKAESLRGAYNKSKNTESQTRISNALNKLK